METGTRRAARKGRIPDGWRLVRLGDVSAPPAYGASAPARTYDPGLPRYIRITDITDDGQLRTGDARSADPEKVQSYELYVGDLLFARSGSVGRTYLYQPEDGPCVFAGYLIRFRPTPDVALPRFVELWTHSQFYHKWVASMLRVGAQPNINAAEYSSLPILLPPLAEQRRIAAVLDAIDEAIERTDAVIAATERLRYALLHELLTRGVPGWHTAWKDALGLGTIPASWNVVRLGDVAEVRNGTTPSRREREYWEDGSIPFVKTGRVNDIFIQEPDEFITQEAASNAGAVVVPEGSVLIAMIGQGKTRGMTARLGFRAAINQNFAAVYDPKVGFGLDYFFAWASHNYSLIRGLGQGSNQDALNCELIQRMFVPSPPVAEQQAIADLVAGVDVSIAEANREREGLLFLKESTADALLSGRVRVGVEE